ncbi:MAG: nickel pincer cofactor biosynthesis protein LarB [Candidatus Bathyarchaeia archaeon]
MRDAKKGSSSVGDAEGRLKALTVRVVGDFAKLDLGRGVRRGIPEVVLAENKTPKETAAIVSEMANSLGVAIVTRVNSYHLKELRKLDKFKVKFYDRAKVAVVSKHEYHPNKTGGRVAILTAGTADIPVAEEAKIIATHMGCNVYTAYDVGVAGLHRLFKPLQKLGEKEIDVFIVVAGREGALPSVLCSLVDSPIIGVPTSSGYGYGGKGEGALMAMLQSCALGLAVVNIDNGVGAGALAALIANKIAAARGRLRRGESPK